MKNNKLTIVINKPIEQVFEYTINPKNTHLWIDAISEQVSSEYPPKIGTEYKHPEGSIWVKFNVTEYKKNERFTLTDVSKNYVIRYSYRKVAEDKTELEYHEWMKNGELENPFTKDILEKLKRNIESKK